MSSDDWWPNMGWIPVISVLEGLRQENLEFWASLGYMASVCSHKIKTKTKVKIITGSIRIRHSIIC